MSGQPSPVGGSPADASATAATAVALVRTHEWFEVNSGWAPPDEGTLVDWGLEGIGRAPDDCLVTERGICRHGLVSWQVVIDDLVDHDSGHVGAEHTSLQPLPYSDGHTGGLTAP